MLRYALAPRWIPLHLLALVVVGAFLRLGWWQWQVSVDAGSNGSGGGWDLQNGFYALQWWVFAGVAVFFWWRFLADERADEQRYADELAAYEAAVRARDEAASAVDDDAVPAEAPPSAALPPSSVPQPLPDPLPDAGQARAEG